MPIPIGDGGIRTRPINCNPWVTRFFILLLFVVFIIDLQYIRKNFLSSQIDFIYLFGFIPVEFKYGVSLSRIIPVLSKRVTPMLTPFTYFFWEKSLLIFLLNIVSIWVLSDNIECRIGGIKYIFLILFSALAGAMGHYFYTDFLTGGINVDYTTLESLQRTYSGVPLAGTSPVIFGLMGAYYLMFPKNKIEILTPLTWHVKSEIKIGYLFVSYIFILIIMTVFSKNPSISWGANLGGLIGGVLFVILFSKDAIKVKRRRKFNV